MFVIDVVSATDYYAFGMVMLGRSFEVAGAYRYGFNGKEKEDGINIDNYDFGARIYDGRVGRWLSVDPMAARYPIFAPYVAFADDPIYFIDPGGETLSTSKEDFKVLNSALIATLGDNHGFSLNEDNGMVRYAANPEVVKSYTKEQLVLRDRIVNVVNHKVDVGLIGVNPETNIEFKLFDKVTNTTKTEKVTLQEKRWNGMTSYSFSEEGAVISMNCFFSYKPHEAVEGLDPNHKDSNPLSKSNQTWTTYMREATGKPYLIGISALHELIGHAELTLTNPELLGTETHYTEVERRETEFRQFYKIGSYSADEIAKLSKQARKAKKEFNLKEGDPKYVGVSADFHEKK